MIEVACQSLNATEAEELRAGISRTPRQSKQPKANLTKQEFKAIEELKSDGHHIILTADKRVALVVMGKGDYIRKMNELLEYTNTDRPLNMDPTNKQKGKLINILRRIKTESGIEDTTYRKMYPTGASSL